MGKTPATLRENNDSVIIEISKQNFGSFFSSVMGKDRSISKTFSNYYSIDKNWIEQVHSLILQRINIQNEAKHITTDIDVYFEKYRQTKYSSIDNFINSNDVANEVTIAFSMQMSFLVKFPYSELPEKQSILVYAKTHRYNYIDFILGEYKTGSLYSKGIYINIDTTNIVWAEEILNQIENKINIDFVRPSFINKILFNRVFMPIKFLMLLMISAPLFLIYKLGQKLREISNTSEVEFDKITSLYGKSIEERIESKLDYLIKMNDFRDKSNSENMFSSNRILLFIAGIFLVSTFIFTFNWLSFEKEVCLNDKTRSLLTKRQNRKNFWKIIVISSLFVGIFASLSASYIYEILN